jgi:hypothetical protein
MATRPLPSACITLPPDPHHASCQAHCPGYKDLSRGSILWPFRAYRAWGAPSGYGGKSQLETGTPLPLPAPPRHKPPYSEKARAVELIWHVICFIVLGSAMVHGLSVAAISIGGHYSRKDVERAPLIGTETEASHGMDHGSDEGTVSLVSAGMSRVEI